MKARSGRGLGLTRSVVLLIVLSLVSLGAAFAGVTLGVGNGPCGSRVVNVATADPAALTVTFGGDTMLGNAAQPTIDQVGYDWPLGGIAPLLDGDFVIVNGEGPVTTRTEPFDPDQEWSYNALPASVTAMRAAGVDALSLGNNHIMDRGPDGLADTSAAAQAAGLATVGAGSLACEAELPLLVRSSAGTLAIVSLGNNYGRLRTASTLAAGTIALSRTAIRRGAALARAAHADWIVAFTHWGENYKDINELQREFAGEFASAGYDLVVGAHPHVTQAYDLVAGMPVLYSLGNLVFGSAGRFPADRPGVGLIAEVRFGSAGLAGIALRCIVTDNDVVQFRPIPCPIEQANMVLGGLGPGVVVVDGVGTIAPPG